MEFSWPFLEERWNQVGHTTVAFSQSQFTATSEPGMTWPFVSGNLLPKRWANGLKMQK